RKSNLFVEKSYRVFAFPYICIMKIEKVIKQPGFLDDYQKVIVNLIYTGNWLRDEQISLLKPYGILPQHFNVLRILKGSHPRPVSPGSIKEVMIDKASDLTRLLDKLEQKKWVNRKLCRTNRRKMDVTISKEGMAVLERMN